MTTRTGSNVYGVGYAAPVGVLRLGTIAPLHALDPATGRAFCGEALSIRWDAEDAQQTSVDCAACLEAIGEEARS